MIITDNPVRDAMRYDWEQEEKLKALPQCYLCDEYIQDEGYYDINGVCYHERCLHEEYWRWN